VTFDSVAFFFVYLSRMKRFVLGLILMFTFSFVGNSLGYATPDDAKIEKVFKTDIEKVSYDIVSIDIEKSKVASAYCLIRSCMIPAKNCKPVEKRIKHPMTLNRRSCIANYNKLNFTKIPLKRYNLPLKVGWNK